MLEDALRDAFAAKAGTAPPGSLGGVADAAIRGAHRLRRRRRTMASGLAGFVIMAIAAVGTFHLVTSSAGQAPPQINAGDHTSTRNPGADVPATNPAVQTPPQAAHREVDAMGGSAQTAGKVRLQLPDKGSVAAAYQAKDGYLVVNNQADGDKQLVLQDDNNKQSVLVAQANNITISKDGRQVAWAMAGTLTVASRDDSNKLLKSATIQVAPTTTPVTFVGSDLVLGREEGGGFDVWYTSRGYRELWDASVVRVFGAHPDGQRI
jgi:hypothetical protein